MTTQPIAWHEAYPEPRNQNPGVITREELLHKLQNQKPDVAADFLVIDLRRTDHEGGSVKGSINLPAQSLYPSLPTLSSLCQQAGIRTVIWYCGSSKGRGTRAAGWFQDLIDEHHHLSGISSVILLGGITAWAKAGDDYTKWMDEYDAAIWGEETKQE